MAGFSCHSRTASSVPVIPPLAPPAWQKPHPPGPNSPAEPPVVVLLTYANLFGRISPARNFAQNLALEQGRSNPRKCQSVLNDCRDFMEMSPFGLNRNVPFGQCCGSNMG